MSLSLLASSAFDTARSTFKAMADAAVPATGQPDVPAAPVAAAEPTAGTTPRPVKGQRLGTVLDAYA
jgi:hypothetical protein